MDSVRAILNHNLSQFGMVYGRITIFAKMGRQAMTCITNDGLFFTVVLFVMVALSACSKKPESTKPYGVITAAEIYNQKTIPVYRYRIIRQFHQPPGKFIEGFHLTGEGLLVSQGLYGHSQLELVDYKNNKTLRNYILKPQFFAEGVTRMQDNIYLLTYKSHKGYIFDTKLNKVGEFHYPLEGWGLTNDGYHLIMSDGSNVLSFIDPIRSLITPHLKVTANSVPVNYLNELEYDGKNIYANVWPTSYIAIIDPRSGTVRSWLDITTIYHNPTRDCVANGIAMRPNKHLLVTGKCWDTIFEIEPVRVQ